LKVVLVLLISVFIMSCAGTKPKPDWAAAQYFKYAKSLFDEEDYYEASNEFTVVVLRFAGTSVADSAQYFLAESHYYMDEYLIAAVEYEKLINSMSRSPLVPQAQFRLAESYFEQSPRASLDQMYTNKAVRAFQTFIEDYPTHELKDEAQKRISKLRDKLAQKAYTNAENYRKMREYDAALIYYDQVLDNYYDSSWADDALAGKIESYVEMEQPDQALKELDKFKHQFPESNMQDKLDQLASELPN